MKPEPRRGRGQTMPRGLRPLGFLAVAFLGLAGCNDSSALPPDAQAPISRERPELGLFTSLPILWNEGDAFAALGQAGQAAGNPVRDALEERYRLRALDTLDGESLAGLSRLVLAQPRPLSGSENVALDDWVRGGGTLILFADPMLTGHSSYALGDPRRPQDVALLSPILARWGLELQYDPAQSAQERTGQAFDTTLPVALPGSFRPLPSASIGENTGSTCQPERGLAVRCAVGDGTVYAIADAAVLQPHEGDDAETREQIARLFAAFRL